MDDNERKELRNHLLERRRELIEAGDLKAGPNRRMSLEQPDEDEQPLNEMNQVILSRRNRVRTEELAGIEAALRRMQDEPEEYGRCLDCDEFIPVGRLRLMPWAQRCVACETKHSGGPSDGRRRHALDFID